MKKIWEWSRDFIVAIAVAVVVLQFIRPTVVEGTSMEPTLQEKNYLLISKQAYTFFDAPSHGDIIVCHSDERTEDGDEKLLIKRIIGVPGDTITISNGEVTRNGEVLDEPYISSDWTEGEIENLVIPDDHIFVMGDNRPVSLDSRSQRIGCVPEKDIVGKAFVRLFPFNEIGLLK